jgi:hypothetical protein
MKVEIKNRFSGRVQITAEIECDENVSVSFKLGLAVKWAIEHKANLRYANLRSANLSSANLSSANLSSANLRYANLRYANLSSANLSSANLRYADLSYANLSSANLRSANLRYADLRSANLSSANLRYADLSSADLSSADLSSADLRYAEMDDDTPIETGETWKEYRERTVPALLQAGGKALLDVVNASWECHSWENCPMAVAFSVHQISDIPILYRARAEQFIKYFDAKMIKKEDILKV